MKKILCTLLCVCILLSLFACGDDNETANPTGTVPLATATPDIQANKPTVAEPNPDVVATLKENLPDHWLDFTMAGKERNSVTVADGTTVEIDEYGATIKGISDPNIHYKVPYAKVDPTEYKYIALRIKVSRTDLKGQFRFGTRSDDRVWSCINYDYKDTADWQTVVLAFKDAEYMESITLNGSPFTQFRFDHFSDDGYEGLLIADEDYAILQSIGFFKTFKEATAFEGIYDYSESSGQAG